LNQSARVRTDVRFASLDAASPVKRAVLACEEM